MKDLRSTCLLGTGVKELFKTKDDVAKRVETSEETFNNWDSEFLECPSSLNNRNNSFISF